MKQRLNHAWRWLGTAFSFASFGIGGLLLPFIAMPALLLVPLKGNRRERRAQQVIHLTFRTYIGMMRALGVLSYEVKGLEKLSSARLVLANHPSLIDVIFLISLLPNANCVVKGKLLSNPFTRGPIRMAGYVANDDAEDVIAAADAAAEKGHALIVFPEGTRTTPGRELDMKRGAANIALRCELDITPVVIRCTPTTLTKQDRWYQVPAKRVHFSIDVRDPIEIEPFHAGVAPSRGARILTRYLNEYFNRELALHEQSAT